jgi:hypothetical protein
MAGDRLGYRPELGCERRSELVLGGDIVEALGHDPVSSTTKIHEQ